MRMVTFNADDFGLDVDTFATTVSCIEAGFVQSATIMAGMPASHDANRIAKDYASHLSFGSHFNIVDLHLPLSRPCRSLCDMQQVFLPSDRQRMRALLHRVDTRHVTLATRRAIAYRPAGESLVTEVLRQWAQRRRAAGDRGRESPGVQDRDEAGLRSQVFRIGGDHAPRGQVCIVPRRRRGPQEALNLTGYHSRRFFLRSTNVHRPDSSSSSL